MNAKKTMKTEKVFETLANKYYEYSYAAEYHKARGDVTVEAELREGLKAIDEILTDLGFREDLDYKRVQTKYTRESDGFSFEYWVIKPIA